MAKPDPLAQLHKKRRPLGRRGDLVAGAIDALFSAKINDAHLPGLAFTRVIPEPDQ
jgi:hypothetical protein